jgi:formyltetrahydrofolate deformylase
MLMAMTKISHRNRSTADRGRLLISCPDRAGIVAAVSRFLFEHGANIVHSDQHSTAPEGGVFFMRVEFDLPGLLDRGPEIESAFADVGRRFDMKWRLAYAGILHRLAVFVSREEHCLLELLWQRRAGDLRAEIVMVISNHRDLEESTRSWGVPFHHVPVPPGRKDEAEQAQLAMLEDGRVDSVVLARYMQILTRDFLSRIGGSVINIHHSFLPAFVGANPYTQAYRRGVKLIGATAHYVTEDLDAGPIIEQDVERVDHRHAPEDLRRIGRAIERHVLARAVAWHVEDRILVHENKTVVFA